MKFIATAATLIVAAQAACSETEFVCDPAESQCTKQETAVGSTKNKEYKKLLKADKATYTAGNVAYVCIAAADVETKMATSGVEDAKSSVTFTYTDLTPVVEAGAGSGASMMKGAFVAAALGLIASM